MWIEVGLPLTFGINAILQISMNRKLSLLHLLFQLILLFVILISQNMETCSEESNNNIRFFFYSWVGISF